MNRTRTVFFDLDGTLLDTAPDMAYVLNQLRKNHGLHELPYQEIRPLVSHGAKALIGLGFGINDQAANYAELVDEFLTLYARHATNATQPFAGIKEVLHYLDEQNIAWGIVTNKPSRFTFDILKSLDLEHRSGCIVCGDTLAKRKPDPEPLLHACNLLQRSAADCVYVGDSIVDVLAAKAAGMPVIVALYGYIGKNEDPFSWHADGYVRQANEITSWLSDNKISI